MRIIPEMIAEGILSHLTPPGETYSFEKKKYCLSPGPLSEKDEIQFLGPFLP